MTVDDPGVHVALFNPEIPQNTGNVARLTAGFAIPLHLVGELAFSLEDRALKRAGVDYWHLVDLRRHASVWHLLDSIGPSRVIPVTTRAERPLSEATFRENDLLVFGNESSGLPPEIHRDFGENALRIEQWGAVRSLNLATAVGIVTWEALRQIRKPPMKG